MAMHLIKLCVGADSIGDLEAWIAERIAATAKRGKPGEHAHTTRMTPKRTEELLDGGSLYWVIKGFVSCRQAIIGLRPVVGKDGIGRCQILLDPKVVAVEPRPRAAFQGWRYLLAKEAPPDLTRGRRADGLAAMPEPLRRELAELGLI
jgi:hypothetical protein